MNLLERIRGDVEGVKLLNEWIGAGGVPVEQLHAQKRSDICEFCPRNVEPNWWERFKGWIADTIKAQLELKRELDLKVDNEDRVGMCSACGCCIRLKVWVPMKHILYHTDEETMNRFVPWCWIRKDVQ